MLYKNLILSIIDYGCILYGSASDTVLKPLNTLQNKELRIALGALHSTPEKNTIHKFTANRLWLRTDIPLAQLATDVLTLPYWARKTTPPLVDSFTQVITCLTPDQTRPNLPCFTYNFSLSMPNNLIF